VTRTRTTTTAGVLRERRVKAGDGLGGAGGGEKGECRDKTVEKHFAGGVGGGVQRQEETEGL